MKVLLHNTSNSSFKISATDRIAQFIFEVCHTPCMIITNTLNDTKRGQGGFGSTNQTSNDFQFINRLKAKMSALRVATQKHNMRLHQINNKPDTPEDACLKSKVIPVQLAKEKSSTSTSNTPSILPDHKVNHSLPKSVRFSRDFLAQSTGFYNNDNIIKYLPDISTNTTSIAPAISPPLPNEGYHATMQSRRRNTKSSPSMLEYSDMWHMDI